MLVFNFEISGKSVNNEQSLKIQPKSIIILVFHFEISGKIFNDEHL